MGRSGPLLHMLYPNIPLVAVKRNENIAEYVSKAGTQTYGKS